MYELEQEHFFYLLLALPVVFLCYLLVFFWKKRKQKQFADASLMKSLSPYQSFRKYWLKASMVLLSIVFLAIALVNPKIGNKIETIKREGVDLVFLLDVSKSMLAEDITPNRLEKAKQLISKIIENLTGDRIGIIVYAGKPYPLLPITTDYSASKLFLDNTDTEIVSSLGTAIGEALLMTENFFDDEKQKNRVILILSDGEDHEKGVVEAAKQLKQKEIKIYAIGLGTEKGAPIPIRRNGRIVDYKKDRNEEMVITKMNEKTLKELAVASGGRYINGSDTKKVTQFVQDELSKTEKSEFETATFTDFKSQFQWFLGIAIFLLLLDVFLLNKKTLWLYRINIFNEKRK